MANWNIYNSIRVLKKIATVKIKEKTIYVPYSCLNLLERNKSYKRNLDRLKNAGFVVSPEID